MADSSKILSAHNFSTKLPTPGVEDSFDLSKDAIPLTPIKVPQILVEVMALILCVVKVLDSMTVFSMPG